MHRRIFIMKKSISRSYTAGVAILMSAFLWAFQGYAAELWHVEENQGRLRAVIHEYSPENPDDMVRLRKLVTFFDQYQIPDTDLTPAQWLRFKHGPHTQLQQALGDASTPSALLSAYIAAYRTGLKTFLDDVVYADPSVYEAQQGDGQTASAAVQATPPTVASEAQTEAEKTKGSATLGVQTDDESLEAQKVKDQTEGAVSRFMARLKERLPVEAKRVVRQAQAGLERLEERLPVETQRLVEQAEERVPVETARIVNQVVDFLRGGKKGKSKFKF